jgi:hypothetical protein
MVRFLLNTAIVSCLLVSFGYCQTPASITVSQAVLEVASISGLAVAYFEPGQSGQYTFDPGTSIQVAAAPQYFRIGMEQGGTPSIVVAHFRPHESYVLFVTSIDGEIHIGLTHKPTWASTVSVVASCRDSYAAFSINLPVTQVQVPASPTTHGLDRSTSDYPISPNAPG